MNHRFPTEEQKRRNRRERLRRNRCQKASRRREAALLRLHEPVLLTSPFVSALTCTELLNQPRVAAVRGLVRRLLSTHNQVQILDFLTTPNGPFFNLAEQLMVLPDQLFEGSLIAGCGR
jgi:hypothetical protein